MASGTDEPWSTWRSLNRLRVQKGRCRAMMKMWKLSHTDVCDCGERQTMSHLMTCGDAPPPPQLHVDRPGFSNPCRCQLCQTLGGINLTVDIEDSTKKIKRYSKITPACLRNSFRTTSISTQKPIDASLIGRALQFGTSSTALLISAPPALLLSILTTLSRAIL